MIITFGYHRYGWDDSFSVIYLYCKTC